MWSGTRHDGLGRHTNKRMVEPPVVIGIRGDVRPFIRIGPQIEQLWKAQRSERLAPDPQRSRNALFGKYKLPVVVAQADQVGVVVEVVELLAWARLCLTGQEWQQVVAI